MKTIILPGYSPRNEQWAEDLVKEINLGHKVIIHKWKHWPSTSSGSSRFSGVFSLKNELGEILGKVGSEKINIIGKSVGTRVAMLLVSRIPEQIDKVVLCGIPTKGESESAKKVYSEGLSHLKTDEIIVFQNTKDPLANYSIIEKFIHSINPKIKVIEKPRSDHHYPYSQDFEKYLRA